MFPKKKEKMPSRSLRIYYLPEGNVMRVVIEKDREYGLLKVYFRGIPREKVVPVE